MYFRIHNVWKSRLNIFKGQNAVTEAAINAGYKQYDEYINMIYDFGKPLDYELPFTANYEYCSNANEYLEFDTETYFNLKSL